MIAYERYDGSDEVDSPPTFVGWVYTRPDGKRIICATERGAKFSRWLYNLLNNNF